MEAYEATVYVGTDGQTPDKLLSLEGYALGLGLPGFTRHDGRGGCIGPTGPEYETQTTFHFIGPLSLGSWAIAAFAAHARELLGQRAVLVVERPVTAYLVTAEGLREPLTA